MDLNRFTQKSQEALQQAQSIAARVGHQQIDVEHLMSAFLSDAQGVLPRVLTKMDIDPQALAQGVDGLLAKLPRISGPGAEAGKIYVTQRLSKVMADAEEQAKRLKDEYVSVEHFVLALLAGESKGALGELFRQFNLTQPRFLTALTAVRGNQRIQSANPEGTYEALERYGRDLVQEASKGKLDPVIGRDDEIRRVIRIL